MKIKKIIFLFFLLALFGCDKDDPMSDKIIPPEDFDHNKDFYNYLLSNFDKNKDGVISVEEANAVTKIKYNGYSLDGLEYFENLEILDCSAGDGSSSCPLNLSKNAKLKELYCNGLHLQWLDVSFNPLLEVLDCSGNMIYEMDLQKNPNLRYLNCSNCELQTKLDLSNNTQLEVLDCSNNYYIKELNISNNPKLKSLKVSFCSITQLNISSSSLLESFYCDGCPISSLDLSKNTSLKIFNCSNLTELNISQNIELEELNVSGSNLTSLDISKNGKLRKLYCENTKITRLDITNSKIDTLFCSVPYINAKGSMSLKKLSCSKTVVSVDASGSTIEDFEYTVDGYSDYIITEPITILLNGCPNLRNVESDYGIYSSDNMTFDVSDCPSLVKFHARSLKSFDISNTPELKDLKCYGVFKELDCSGNTGLEKIDCNSTTLQSVNLKNCTALKDFICYGQLLRDIDFSDNINLENVKCESYNLYSLDVSTLSNLKSLDIHFSSRDNFAIDLRKNNSLENIKVSISIYGKGIVDLNASGLNSLKNAYLYGNLFGEVDFSECANLKNIDGTCNSKTINIEDCFSLEKLSLSGVSEMTSLDISQYEELDTLSFSAPLLTDLTLNKNLKSLQFSSGNIKKIDVSGCSKLTSLYLDNCKMEELDISKNAELLQLSCRNSKLKELDASNCKKLKLLICEGSPELETLYLYWFHECSIYKDYHTNIVLRE